MDVVNAYIMLSSSMHDMVWTPKGSRDNGLDSALLFEAKFACCMHLQHGFERPNGGRV